MWRRTVRATTAARAGHRPNGNDSDEVCDEEALVAVDGNDFAATTFYGDDDDDDDDDDVAVEFGSRRQSTAATLRQRLLRRRHAPSNMCQRQRHISTSDDQSSRTEAVVSCRRCRRGCRRWTYLKSLRLSAKSDQRQWSGSKRVEPKNKLEPKQT